MFTQIRLEQMKSFKMPKICIFLGYKEYIIKNCSTQSFVVPNSKFDPILISNFFIQDYMSMLKEAQKETSCR